MGVRLFSCLLLVGCSILGHAAVDIVFSADRYPTGVEGCSWLNWIADRTNSSDLNSTKKDIIKWVDSLGADEWASIGNGILQEDVFDAFRQTILAMPCSRDTTLVANCVGLSDIGCKFKDFTSNDSTVIFNKTDGAVASPPNHKVVAENDFIRVVNVYCPLGELETAYHTHTRLSFWLSYGVGRGERYHAYDGSLSFDAPLWDGKEKSKLSIMWNGPEWFHLLEEKELGDAPGNCPAALAPSCSNGFKYRVELKLNAVLDNYGLSLIRKPASSTVLV